MIQKTLIKFAIAFFIIFTVTACFEEREGQQAVDAFLKDMSPELARKINKIGKEIHLTEGKIDKLSKLKLKHPKYSGKIETARRQWKVLQDKLKQSLKEIRDVVESAYVTYELDKIQGGNQFNKISNELLSSADLVLASAGTTKEMIEQALNEAESQPLPSLDSIDHSPDIPKPTEHHRFENEEQFETPPTFEVAVEEPFTESEPPNIINPPEPSPNLSSFCDAKIFLADVRLNLMMMVISTEQVEQDNFKIEIDKASTEFERTIAVMLRENYVYDDQFATLKKTWIAFKNSLETEIIPAIQIGDNDKALEIAHGIQARRVETMNNIIQTIHEEHCD